MKTLLFVLFALCAYFPTSFAQPVEPLTVNLDGARNFSQDDYDKLVTATKLINVVVNSEDFKNAVLNFSYSGAKEFVQNLDMTNSQIYSYLMLGAEKYPAQTSVDHVMNFDLELYTSNWFGRNTLGYTDITTKTIHMNTRFYDRAEPYEIAMNMVHEWTHKMGFDHDKQRTDRRDYSVPYGVGYIVRDLASKINVSTLP